jgi:hypothetical protein
LQHHLGTDWAILRSGITVGQCLLDLIA